MRKGIFLLLLIPIIFNLGEILNPSLGHNGKNFAFIAFYLFPLVCALLFFKQKKITRPNIELKVLLRLTLLALISILPFLWFLISNQKSFNIIDYIQFMESYRNGAYKGSGLFTFPATNIFPLIYCFAFFSYSIPKKQNILFTLISILPSLLLGFRVWLVPLFITYIIIFFNKKVKLFNLLKLSFVLLILILSTKIILAPDIYLSNVSDVVLRILSRTNYQALSTPKDLNLLSQLIETLNINEVKEYFYFKNQYYIESIYFSRVWNTAGLAIPATIFLINSLGYYFSSILFFATFCVIHFLFNYANQNSSKISLKSFSFFLAIMLMATVIEDINFAAKILIIPLLVIVNQIIFYTFSLKK